MTTGTSSKNTIKQCTHALIKCDGNITRAAKELGCNRSSLSGRVRRNEKLQAAQAQGEENIIDIAESQLLKKIEDGHFPSIKLALLCKGKRRGWVLNPIEDEKDTTSSAELLKELVAYLPG